MNIQQVLEKLKQKFSGQPFEIVETKPDPYLKVPVDTIHAVMEYLKNDLQFDTLSDLCAVDHIKESMLSVVYHPFSYVHKGMICLKVYLPREGTPSIDSIVDLFKAADWMERETYDMFGIVFRNHPNLRRILMPEDWEGYPLRKDFITPDYYNGMPVPLYFDDTASDKEGGHA